jgi:hypothetical protein
VIIQPGQDKEDRTHSKEQLDRVAVARQPECDIDNQDRIERTGQNTIARTAQLSQENWDRTVGTG